MTAEMRGILPPQESGEELTPLETKVYQEQPITLLIGMYPAIGKLFENESIESSNRD